MNTATYNAPSFCNSVDCVHAGTVTVEHVRGMLQDEHMTASVKRMRGLPPIEMRLLQLVAHQDDKRRRKGEDQWIAYGSAGPRSKAEPMPLQRTPLQSATTDVPNNRKSIFLLKMHVVCLPHVSSNAP